MAKLSRRERWQERTGVSKYAYKDSAEGKAVKKIKKYYEEDKEFTKKQKNFDLDKLKKDFELVLQAAGIEKSRSVEDYARNIGRLEQDKATDLEDLNYYLTTNRGRTQEDLDVSMKKELRRYSLEQDKLNESVAARNVVFSGMSGIRGKEQGLIDEETQMNQDDYMRSAKRSFQDLARLEFVKNAAIETQYGRATEDESTKKERAIQDIEFGVKKANQAKTFSEKQIGLNWDKYKWSNDNEKDTDIALVENQFSKQFKQEQYEKPLWNLLMS